MKQQAHQKSPRQTYRDALQKTILDAGRKAADQGGYESVSLRKLAESVGCSHANLYLYFKDKDDIFEALVESSFARFDEGFRRILESEEHEDPVHLLTRAAHAYVEFGLQNPGAYEFAFVLRRPGRPRKSKPHDGYWMLRGLVKRCIDTKRFRTVDVDEASQALWAAVHGITALLITHPHFPWADKEAVTRRVIETAIGGLLRQPRRSPSAAS